MDKRSNLFSFFKGKKNVMVAFSGGIDSTLLLYVACRVLGKNVTAVTVNSELMTFSELEDAKNFAKDLDVNHLIVSGNELENEEFIKNTPQRCYHCKKQRFLSMIAMAKTLGIQTIVEGSNVDDIKDYRPGNIAVKELGIASPLQDAGLTKDEIRQLAKEFNLPYWNKPSEPCLATRINYGNPINLEVITRVRKAEEHLKNLLGTDFCLRVRDHGNLARIEIPPVFLTKVFEPSEAEKLYLYMKDLGYVYTTIDILGYRQGSMNEILKDWSV